MKNSNNIKWGVSTADTLLLRALQTDRVTRYTHYAATVQPLSVMMMAALTGPRLLKPPRLQTLLRRGGGSAFKKKKKGKKSKGVRSRCVQARLLWFYLLMNVTGHRRHPPPLHPPPPSSSSSSSDHFIGRRTHERCRLRYQRSGIPTIPLHVNTSWQAGFTAPASDSHIRQWVLVSRSRKKKQLT